MISVVIPCYNSSATIKGVVDDIVIELNNKEEFEIILVNDGSSDNVWEVIENLKKEYPNIVKGICFSTNFGQHSAILAGYRMAKGNIVVSMDDDGQTSPKYICKLIDKLDEGYDVVFARYPVIHQKFYRNVGSEINRKMTEIMVGKPKDLQSTSFFVLKRFIVDEITRYEGPYPYLGGLIFRATKNIGEVSVEHQSRKVGKSGYTMRKLIKLWLNGFTAFSIKPLRIATLSGFVFAAVGILYGIYTIIKKICFPQVEVGYSSLMSMLTFTNGITMILIGVIGEYVGRSYININNAPQYVIRETTEEHNDGNI